LDAARRLAASGIESARLDARLLWEHAQKSGTDFDGLVARREKREPIAYISGHKEFWSLDFEVGPGVLIPRPDTETLVEEALKAFPDKNAPLRVLDLGTGSGVEQSPDAMIWARKNIARHKLETRLRLQGDDWLMVGAGPFDVIFSNPP